jgi:hypothetical protein
VFFLNSSYLLSRFFVVLIMGQKSHTGAACGTKMGYIKGEEVCDEEQKQHERKTIGGENSLPALLGY